MRAATNARHAADLAAIERAIAAYAPRFAADRASKPGAGSSLPAHLKALEAESIYIMREVAAEFDNPVMLYSIGKDSSVMLHLAMKAFWPSRPPFPLLHVDTTWKFKAMIKFRDELARRLGLDLKVHVNAEGVERVMNPNRSD